MYNNNRRDGNSDICMCTTLHSSRSAIHNGLKTTTRATVAPVIRKAPSSFHSACPLSALSALSSLFHGRSLAIAMSLGQFFACFGSKCGASINDNDNTIIIIIPHCTLARLFPQSLSRRRSLVSCQVSDQPTLSVYTARRHYRRSTSTSLDGISQSN